ncbi:MAG: DUF1365 domain-containing protein, partial [Bacteroidetes bacterium]|nr:DUF1365 domain-containing protein [Bacteroidota bacterium]
MNSCLYKATVMHHRLMPVPHRFHYGVFMFYIDLDELPLLCNKLWMFGHNRFNYFSFRDREHLQLPGLKGASDAVPGTKEQLLAWLRQNGIVIERGRIMLLTNLNVLGYNFNPVSFYFCFDDKNDPLCCVAEVSNTFREMKPYLAGMESREGDSFHLNTKKYFYVSPFIDHDAVFDFSMTVPGEKLNIRIDDFKEDQRIFISTLTGRRKELTNRSLLWYSIRFPLITLRV